MLGGDLQQHIGRAGGFATALLPVLQRVLADAEHTESAGPEGREKRVLAEEAQAFRATQLLREPSRNGRIFSAPKRSEPT